MCVCLCVCVGGGVRKFEICIHVPRGDLGSGPSLKMGEGARVSERSLTGKTRDFRATNNKETYIF